LDQFLLLAAELRGSRHLHADLEIAAAAPAQAGDATILDRDDLRTLGTGFDLDRNLTIERLERRLGAENRIRHLHLECRQEVVAVAAEHVVVAHLDLEIEVTVRAAGRADLTLRRHLQAQPGVDARGNVDGDGAARANAALALAGGAWVRDDRAVAAAGTARTRGHHIAEQAADGA